MLSGSRWSDNLFGILNGVGFIGSRLRDFTDAVGPGSTDHVIGKSFTTQDVGLVPGTGTGTGNGVVGFTGGQVANEIFSRAQGFGFIGDKLLDLCDALGQATAEEMAQAGLSSHDAPVFSGVGTIVPGSIGVNGSAWGVSIRDLGDSEDFKGSKWPDLADAIGGGQAFPVQSIGTGTLTISGSSSGPTSPGTGAGSGTIS